MRDEHRNVQSWICEHYADKYNVEAEIKAQNKLPDKKRHWYQPDVILRNKRGEIEYIIEVENRPARKAIVGASVLADACLEETGQNKRAKLYFVIFGESGIKQMAHYRERIKIVKPYCRQLADIKVLSIHEFKGQQV